MNPKLAELSKRRGIFWPSFEIYGGVSGFIDLGPIGVKIMRKIEERWRHYFVNNHEFIYEISTPIITPEIVLEASGHLEHFVDLVLTCSKCGRKYRVDQLIEEKGVEGWDLEKVESYVKEKSIKCPECNGEFEKPSKFNLLMKTTIGPYSDNIGYLRPEAAQGIFVDFRRIYESIGKKLPFGIFQVGKVGRNEISPRKGLYRMREFTIIDLEFFYDKENPDCKYIQEIANRKIRILRQNETIEETIEYFLNKELIKSEWMAYFLYLAKEFLIDLGIDESKQYFLEKSPEERAHYSSQTFDQMVVLSDGTHIEVSGHALRTDYDLRRHSEKSGVNLMAERIVEGKIVEKFYPYVVEPSFGLERLLLVTLDAAYREIKNRIVLKLPYSVVSYQVAVIPLVRQDQLVNFAREIHLMLKKTNIESFFETVEYIGKAYAKADEIGIPYAVTVDYQSLEDNTVTIRDRESWEQVRVSVRELPQKIKALLNKEINFKDAGKPVTRETQTSSD